MVRGAKQEPAHQLINHTVCFDGHTGAAYASPGPAHQLSVAGRRGKALTKTPRAFGSERRGCWSPTRSGASHLLRTNSASVTCLPDWKTSPHLRCGGRGCIRRRRCAARSSPAAGCFGLLKLFALGKRAPALGPRPGPGRISTPPRALRGSSRKASERLGQAFITAEPCRSDDREKQGARLDLPRISLLHGCQTTSSSSISSRGMLLPLVPYMYLSRLQALGP